LWERGQEENYTVVKDGGNEISLLSPDGEIELNGRSIERTHIMEGGYPKISLGWAGEANGEINKGDLILVCIDVSPKSSKTCVANAANKGRFDKGMQGDNLELSKFPEKLNEENEILGQEIIKAIDFDIEAEKIIKDSKLTDLFAALIAIEKVKIKSSIIALSPYFFG
jgi:hypothetical protein